MTANQKLASYLKIHGLDAHDLAVRANVSFSMADKLVRGDRRPGLDLAARLQHLTGGAVLAIDWAKPVESEVA